MNPVLENVFKSSQVVKPSGEAIPLHSAVSRDEGLFLQRMISAAQPKVVVEVGLAYGISALFICEALVCIPGSRLIAIDPFQSRDWEGVGLENLKRAGYSEMVQLIEKPSQAALPQLVESGLAAELAFIDGMHTFDHALVDFFYADQLLRVGGIVVLDDTNFRSVRKLARFIVTNRAYTVCGFVSDQRTEFRRRALRSVSGLTKHLGRVVRPEIAEPDHVFGWAPWSRCIAFRKTANDSRDTFSHRAF